MKYPGPWTFLCSGIEGAAIDMAPLGTIEVDVRNAHGDKFVRAQPVAARWNGVPDIDGVVSPGRVFLPRNAPWVPRFLEEVGKFTGVGDREDDQVDALINAFENFRSEGPSRIYVPRASSEPYRFPSERGF